MGRFLKACQLLGSFQACLEDSKSSDTDIEFWMGNKPPKCCTENQPEGQDCGFMLQTEAGLNPLRPQPEFRLLMLDLAFPAGAIAPVPWIPDEFARFSTRECLEFLTRSSAAVATGECQMPLTKDT